VSGQLKVTFLGTGTSQGVPVIACSCEVCNSVDPRDKRLRSSVLLEWEGRRVVIDSGPDFRQQLLREKVLGLDAIVFTHDHKDHIAGLDEVRAFNYINRWRAQVYCTADVEISLRREFHYAFSEVKYPGIPEIDIHRIDQLPFEIKGMKFIPIKVWHYNLPVFGYRIGDFTYITDANRIEDSEMEKIKGSKVFVLNALRHEAHPSHFTLKEAIGMAQWSNSEKTFFTHISHQLGCHSEVENILPHGMALAYDGLTIEIPMP
jgi:phosphoribosyl 1,2-cyclic phosphate phosphodiesterase